MPVSNPSKTLKLSRMNCREENTMTISFNAEPELRSQSADMVFILDHSTSMRGDGLKFAKTATKDLMKKLAQASGDPQGLFFRNGSRMSLVSFGDDASLELPLGTSVAAINEKLDRIIVEGRTNHQAAFTLARNQLRDSTAPRKVVIIMTDGESNIGNADPVVEAMKLEGIEIFCIGLAVNPSKLKEWATDPDESHVVYTDDAAQLDVIYNELEKYIVRAGVRGMVLKEELNADFEICSKPVVSRGSVEQPDSRSLIWRADVLGDASDENVSMSFKFKYIGTEKGIKEVNKAVSYEDLNGNVLNFASPDVNIECGDDIVVDPCALPVPLSVEGCRDAVRVDTNPVAVSGLGRIVQVNAEVKNVCPGKRLAVAVVLTETDGEGAEHNRGLKTILVPAQTGTDCRNISLRCIDFVVPEGLDLRGSTESICNSRSFNARVFANYVDTDYSCCEAQTTV